MSRSLAGAEPFTAGDDRARGIRIAYSRRPGATGYYHQYPPLKRLSHRQYEAVNWELIERIKQLSEPEKNEHAFAAADFALGQKRLILVEKHPEWPPEKVDKEAHRLVFGVAEELFPTTWMKSPSVGL